MNSFGNETSRAKKTIVLAALFLAWAVGYADRIVMSLAIIPVSKEFALDAQQAGMVLSAFYLSYAIMQLFGGWVSDRYGSRIVIVLCVVAWSIFTGATALAWSFASLLVIRFLFGMGEGCFSPASSVTVAETFPKNERARAKSFLISTAYLGKAAGSGLLGLTMVYLGWRGSFHILMALGVITSIILWFALKGGMAAQRLRASSQPAKTNQFKELLKDPAALKLTAIWFCASMLSIGLNSWMPSYLSTTYNIDLLHVGLASAVPYLLGFAGTNAVGWMLDKFGNGREKYFMMFGAFGCIALMTLMMNTKSMSLLIIYWTLCMLSYNFIYATCFAIPLKRFRPDLIGSATGLMNFGGQLAGSVGPMAMGALIVQFNGSYFAAFGMLVASSGVALLIALTWCDAPQSNAGNATAQIRLCQ
ncbi:MULTISPECIES: MFS transporter [unclassified Pseudomonas]|uniref:MFS transporter n=1 Tax=unclassified Pseudomonas TaxID=196821 RepID=UPI000CD30F89|nr:MULTISPECIES: MFS transporter [unclassified Pseudomonas]POA14670.1 MFS transporter [Pseudomonas sp. MPBD7-1]